MQKLDFVKKLEIIVDELQSNEIAEKFIKGFTQPGGYGYSEIKAPIFISKSNYDKLNKDAKYSEILNSLNGDELYSVQNLSNLTTILQQTNATSVVGSVIAVTFFNFHNSLMNTLKITKDILLNETLEKSNETNLNEGVLIFQIVIENEGLSTEKYIKIFTALEELVSTLGKIEKDDEIKSEIILLDSGSDTNLGVRTTIETAKSLFLIFKEIWDFIINYKYYNTQQKNNALLESLTIRTEIQKKIDEKILTEDEGKEYLHLIKTRTDDLIGLKVLPKQIVIETNQIENKKLLSGLEGRKFLTSGE